jgi:predicted nucleic acid-binding protein
MTPFLLDTNIIVDVLRRRKNARLELEKLLSHDSPLASCPITITEVYAGMRPHEEKSTRAFMKSLIFLPVTEDIAEHPRSALFGGLLIGQPSLALVATTDQRQGEINLC